MGSVIGKGGAKIKEIQEASGARLVASEEILPHSTERTITITGVPDAIHIAVYHVGLVLQSAAGNDRDRERDRMTIPYRPMGRGAAAYGSNSGPMGGHGGYGGHSSGYYGGYPSHGGHQGHHGGAHGGYGHDYMPMPAGGSGGPGSMTQAQQIFIPNDMVGSVIGKGGSKINEIRQTSGSHIKIAEAPSAGNERLVTITGTPESNQMAVYLLYSRLESEKARQ
jgi:heterogeneous nuclear rnp K-like protein 2